MGVEGVSSGEEEVVLLLGVAYSPEPVEGVPDEGDAPLYSFGPGMAYVVSFS